MGKLTEFFFKNYKKFLFIPFILLFISFILIFIKFANTGEFLNKDISLKGGLTITVLYDGNFNTQEIESSLLPEFSPYTVSVRQLKSTGQVIGFLIESDLQEITQDKIDSIVDKLNAHLGTVIDEESITIESTGSALGNSFFTQIIRALILAFIFMGVVVFIYFRSFVPSTAVILSALSDIVVTLAIVNILGIKISTAGIAAFLMLIGYSIDTDIMLTTRVIKRKGPLEDAIVSSFKTGMTMTLTTIAAVTVALIFTDSEVIRQIMTILLIGLVIDILNTWVQNSGLLIWYVQRKNG